MLADRLSAVPAGLDPDLVLAVSDAPDPAVLAAARATGRPVLPVIAEMGHVRIGPLERPGEPGCSDCLSIRRHRAATRSAEREAVWLRHGESMAGAMSPLLVPAALDLVAALVAGAAAGRGGILLVDLADLAVTPHSFLPDPLCGRCGELPDDSPERARVTLVPRPKPALDQYRVWDAEHELDRLIRTYVDDHTGLVNSLTPAALGSLAVAGAAIRLRGTTVFEPGFGRSRSYRRSSAIALLEALERYGAIGPGGRRGTVRASYASLGDRAVDPRSLGLHPPTHYALPDFPYRPFTVDAVCRWVWGHSFAAGGPVLVPERNVYYGRSDDQPFCYELANGCALGSCLEEAIFHGILEVLERDAFLLTWYTRARAPRIDLGTARDPGIPLVAAAITAETGYLVECYDITPDHGVPCVWALARTLSGEPATISAAAAGTSLEHAAAGALAELGPMVPTVREHFPPNADRARTLAADGSRVRSMIDHYLVYGVRSAAERLSFLTEGTTRVPFPPPPEGFRHQDLTLDLEFLIDRLADVGLDVIVVDLTTPEHRAGGLRCVKVLVPGAVPMTFGEQNRRTWGLPRLLDPAAVRGRGMPVRVHADLNPDPHPFP
ncbi:SagD family biosynthesis docking scaffold protein [Planobispora rosea]|uniref:PbtG1 n=1 Tax=Planobispora rosea TaxID=35762 RepID=U5Q0H1_PLARO|nr:TOMM precursor leader peptide-binding protein [Planobispora rosea]AGY49581.1 PbtG1 [Planobispora rosea]GGS80243.1 SagD family biosynthesis docking scaffold protein [Planobispora rosea]GIH86036.1 SagD family biosynthesis docking scaffold protein [Planobispora rosea]